MLCRQHQLACLLLWHAKQGAASPLQPWLEALPHTFNNLAQWSSAELDELQLGSASAEVEFRAQVKLTQAAPRMPQMPGNAKFSPHYSLCFNGCT